MIERLAIFATVLGLFVALFGASLIIAPLFGAAIAAKIAVWAFGLFILSGVGALWAGFAR